MSQIEQFLKTAKRRKALLQVTKSYHTIKKHGRAHERNQAEFSSKNGRLLLDLIQQCQWACDELIDIAGRAANKAARQLSGRAGVWLRRPSATAGFTRVHKLPKRYQGKLITLRNLTKMRLS